MPTENRLGRPLRAILLTLGYVAAAGFVLFPILWILMMSFKEFGDIIAYPPRFIFTPTLANYEEVLFGTEAQQAAGVTPDFLRNLVNSIIISGGTTVEIAADPVTRVVDTTGAGDLYAAGFLYGHATGRSLETAGRLASIAAAEAISHIGPRPLVPLDRLAREKGLDI